MMKGKALVESIESQYKTVNEAIGDTYEGYKEMLLSEWQNSLLC